MSEPTISLGLGARELKDKDFFSKSDPYVTISRPDTSGGFTVIRSSETKKNTLNPDWDNFLFIESELNGNDKELSLRIEVFDDDGRKGKDKLIGIGFYSLKELEAAALLNAFLPLKHGKKDKETGQLLVLSFKEHNVYSSVGGYPQERGIILRKEGLIIKKEGLILKQEGLIFKKEGLILKKEGLILKQEGLIHILKEEGVSKMQKYLR
eukprot:GFUD01015771.1.p1 GENE.GFUD01015771.1~~GFUD01015771.1.p1  ORF type:complete len:209 (+),score=50.84 GFUD01015771.1:100-726(+)